MTRIRNKRKEAKITGIRMGITLAAFLLLFLGLSIRFYHLQIHNHTYYTKLSKQNSTQFTPLYAYRADIVDRYGQYLANHQAIFHLIVDNPSNQSLAFLAQHGILPTQSTLSDWQYALLSHHPLSGVDTFVSYHRHYSKGPAFSHLLGYVSPSNDGQLPDPNSPFYQGRAALELLYNDRLTGKVGQAQHRIDAKGTIHHTSIKISPKRHSPLILTIDSELQQFIYEQMIGLSGACVALNPQNGEILALVSTPSYDNNQIKQTLNQTENTNIKPLFNRYLQALYPPASLVKPFIALGALTSGDITPKDTIYDPGYYQVNDHSKRYRNHHRSGHGLVNLEKALILSNDTYFYALAHQIGIDKIVRYLQAYGFGQKTQIDLRGEVSSVLPTKAYRQQHYDTWYTGQTIISGIGQGDLLSTPIQLLRAIMLLANDGVDYPLHLTPRYVLPSKKILHHDPQLRQTVIDALSKVSINGTAKSIGKKPYTLAAKTGTAQVASLAEHQHYHELPHEQKDHHLFMGFSPINTPTFALVIIIEHQSKATQIAEKILDWCYEHHRITSV